MSRSRLGLVLVFALLATACGATGEGPFPDPKPPMAGLIDRWGLPPEDIRDVVGGLVVDVSWSELQPVAAGPIVRPNAIDDAIRAVTELNAADPQLDLVIKLRVRTGIDAPGWAKELDGEPVAVTDPVSGVGGTVGRFWTDQFGHAYSELHRLLAELYDGVPELREVTIARCTTVFAEPLIRNMSHPDSVSNLRAAGISDATDFDCLRQQIEAHRVWESTRSGLALNPYQAIGGEGKPKIDIGVTRAVMAYCRDVLGERCVLENNSIRWPRLEGAADEMYVDMAALGPPISLQTAALVRVGDLTKTIEWAVDRSACAVELPAGYHEVLDREQLSALGEALGANPGCAR